MRLSLVGVNHQTAPITIREKVAISAEKLCDFLSLLRSYIPQGVILSTCNRTEIYVIDSDGCNAEKASLVFLNEQMNVSGADLLRYVYVSKDREATEHLFRVASGLESMIVGEFEVLGQVRQALEVAEKAGMVTLPLRHAFYSAVRTGRRVREETGISKNAISVSSVAVDLAADIVGDLTRCKMLVIGAGEAGRLVVEVARKRGISQMVIASRTKERAQALATELHGTPIDLSNLSDELRSVDIVVACAGAPHWILNVSHMEEVMRKRSGLPLVLVDIALPRNVEPEVGRIRNVFLYNMDDLNDISNLNRKQREAEVSHAEEIITSEVDKFVTWLQDFEVRPIVSALMSKAEKIRSIKLNKTLKKLRPLSDDERDSLEAMTKSIVTRILKDPVEYLKADGNSNHSQMVRELFQLNTDEHSKG